MRVVDLGTLSWQDAWKIQEQAHTDVLRGGEARLILVEHPPVITLGRQADLSLKNLRFSVDELKQQGIDVVETDRGGNVTFHGPGQLVAYPIIKLSDLRLTVGGYVKALQQAVIDCIGRCMVRGEIDPSAVGVWVKDGEQLAKVCAIGVRVRRGVTLHGLALNVTTDLRYFDLIVPCGLQNRPVTNLKRTAGIHTPQMSHMKWLLTNSLKQQLEGGRVDVA
ncbi:MAG: lipoyl(octanoyl) transferase LipB [Tepidisphaeraceae bacterium]